MRRFLVAVVALAAWWHWRPPRVRASRRRPRAGGEGEGGEAVKGTLRYDDESGEQVGAEGVTITVESADGSFSETAKVDADGVFEVPVPAPAPTRSRSTSTRCPTRWCCATPTARRST